MTTRKPKETNTILDTPPATALQSNLNSAACEPLAAYSIKPRKIVRRKGGAGEPAEKKPPEISADIFEKIETSAEMTEKLKLPVTDEKFLETIRDMVYEKLIEGEMELKIDYGFKAIELKQRITDGSQNEKLLLEILNEIRKEELGKIG